MKRLSLGLCATAIAILLSVVPVARAQRMHEARPAAAPSREMAIFGCLVKQHDGRLVLTHTLRLATRPGFRSHDLTGVARESQRWTLQTDGHYLAEHLAGNVGERVELWGHPVDRAAAGLPQARSPRFNVEAAEPVATGCRS